MQFTFRLGTGPFDVGDAISLVDEQGELGRGLARYSMGDVARLAGARTNEIEGRVAHHGGDEIVHRDDMVLTR